MKKSTISVASVFLTGALMLAGTFRAQDAPAAKPTPAPAAAPAPAAKAAQTPAAKTGQSTTAKKPGPAPLVLKTPKDKESYAIGLNIGKGLHKDAVDVDPAILARGVKDALAGGKTLMTDDEAKAAMVALQADVRKRQEAKMAIVGDANKKEGDAFLAENKTKDGVVTLADGLQYKILKEGTGPKPTAKDSVVCNYKGTLLDNTEFDSSYKRGQPATFPVGQVIKGWTEVLQLMPVGSKWEVFVPSDLAYGARGAGPGAPIGPNATLIFEIELLSIQSK
ncbi:MAG: FKBP-type peptidyl-prolyl cis-trans isomerase [Candidatus Acidiferrum sp.]|jgi:FKBP-type peptidyl-prolyl cis-trans isomerase FklB